jgi:hypothetical protein
MTEAVLAEVFYLAERNIRDARQRLAPPAFRRDSDVADRT